MHSFAGERPPSLGTQVHRPPAQLRPNQQQAAIHSGLDRRPCVGRAAAMSARYRPADLFAAAEVARQRGRKPQRGDATAVPATTSHGTRSVVFDTETTGLAPLKGDRIIEIAALELVNDLPTSKRFHVADRPGARHPGRSVARSWHHQRRRCRKASIRRSRPDAGRVLRR